jgi:hypothetical protein
MIRRMWAGRPSLRELLALLGLLILIHVFTSASMVFAAGLTVVLLVAVAAFNAWHEGRTGEADGR